MTPKPPRSIIFLLTPNMLATSVTMPLEMLRAAWAMAKVQNHTLAELKVSLLTEHGDLTGDVATQTGIHLTGEALGAPPQAPAIIFVPALWRDPMRVIKQHPQTIRWLASTHSQHTIAAVGTGVCFVAAAGLLDQKPATTHWHYANQFAKQFPQVALKRDVFITRSERFFCTASINALAEITAFFIQEEFGLEIAQAVERNFFHEIRGQRTRAEVDAQAPTTTDELMAQARGVLQEWAANSLTAAATRIHMKTLATDLGISMRSFNRRFKEAMGLSPLQYLQQLRMNTAEELLKTSNLSITDIASHAGYQDPQLFARQFKKVFHVAPSQYRQTVRAKVFT